MLGAACARESRTARSRHRVGTPIICVWVVGLIDAPGPERSQFRIGRIAIPPPGCCGPASRTQYSSEAARYDSDGEPWLTPSVCYYFINDSGPVSFVVDVSGHYDKKTQALACYASQFIRAAGSTETRLNTPAFGQLIESRDALFGALAGVRYAEGFVVTDPVIREHLLK